MARCLCVRQNTLPKMRGGWEYSIRHPILGGKAYYDEAEGTYTQRGKTITFNLTASGERVFGFPSTGIHTITFTSGEVVGIANLAMDVNYEAEKESGERRNGTLKFMRQ